MKFSERYGYVKPVDALRRGGLDRDIETALCNCFDHLDKWFNHYDVEHGNHYNESYTQMEEMIWRFFMNQRRDGFYSGTGHLVVATQYLLSSDYEWYLKFDMIEFAIRVLRHGQGQDSQVKQIVDTFVQLINSTFKRLNYAYRIVDDHIVEISDDEEIKTIEQALVQTSAVKTHLSSALKLLSDRTVPDYRNSIKESISAVEALCREITGENTLGEALKKLEKKGITIQSFLKSGFEKLYVYTNDSKTGIRHALMDDTGVPTFDEAKFMLVACGAFVNYIQGKRSNIQ